MPLNPCEKYLNGVIFSSVDFFKVGEGVTSGALHEAERESKHF